MARFLILLGILLVLIGFLWEPLTRLGLGRLPGDIVIERGNTTIYIPITTSILISILLSAVLWLLGMFLDR